MDEKKNEFRYVYSAPTEKERKEIESIASGYKEKSEKQKRKRRSKTK